MFVGGGVGLSWLRGTGSKADDSHRLLSTYLRPQHQRAQPRQGTIALLLVIAARRRQERQRLLLGRRRFGRRREGSGGGLLLLLLLALESVEGLRSGVE